jgi:hypothetical protein
MTGVSRHEWGNQAQWAVTSPLLAAAVAGVEWAYAVALGLAAASAVYYALRLRSVRAYRVQIRLGFLAVAGLAAVPGLRGVLWIPLLGTTAQVLVGYCPMARLLDLMPWNRAAPLTWTMIASVATRRPGSEGLLSAVLRPAGQPRAERSLG